MEKIAIVGTGTMGSAIERLLGEKYQVQGFAHQDDKREVDEADVVIMAVKPQSFAEAVDQLWLDSRKAHQRHNRRLYISVIAGITLGELCCRLGTENVVRTMPNLGLVQGESLTAWLPAQDAAAEQAESIISMWGQSMLLDNESQFDAFTALAGSGPAYFFELARILEAAARERGFGVEQARLIATQTFLGAASVVGRHTDFAVKVEEVTSKGGTTAAARRVLAERDFDGMVYSAVDAAANRSRQLGNG